MKLVRVTITITLIITLITGCASTPPPPLPSLPRDKIALVAAQYIPETNFDAFAAGKTKAAGKLGGTGVKKGVAYGVEAGATVPLTHPLGIALYPVIAPFTILIGAIAGGVIGGVHGATQGLTHGLSEEDVKSVREVINNALSDISVQTEVAKRIESKALAANLNVVYLKETGPESLEHKPDYAFLSEQGFGAVLELTVVHTGFAVRKGEPPRLSLEMKLNTRVIDLSGKGVSGQEEFIYNSRPRYLEDWGTGNGQLLAEEFQLGYDTLANKVNYILFK